MNKRINIFTKIVVLLLALIVPVVIMFSFNNFTSVKVIRGEIEQLKENQFLSLFRQLNERIKQISMNSITLTNSTSVEELEFQQFKGSVSERQRLLKMISDDISLQSGITGWQTEITLYSRMTNEVLSTSADTITFNDEELIKDIERGWQYQQDNDGKPRFVWYTVSPITAFQQLEEARTVVKISFPASYVQNMLDQYKTNGQGDPYLYHPQHGVIANRTMNTQELQPLNEFLMSNPSEGMNVPVTLNETEYMTSYKRLQAMDWYLVDVVPMQKIISPITVSQRWFYFTIVVLLLMSIMAAYVLYKDVQVPIRELVRHVQRIKKGNYKTRIAMNGGSEFSFLFLRFNEMSQQIHDLLDKVYMEKLRSREAVLKQMQSQINPHFLYNCLFYIKNMARMGDEDTVVEMALNLGEYFRYTTRLGVQDVELQEEIKVIVNYLEIQNLRMKRIEYEIDLPTEVKALIIPRLLLQPIVENAVIHGLEPKEGTGMIIIHGEVLEHEYRIIISDNGVGMSDQQLQRLQELLGKAEEEVKDSYALWNIHQRIRLKFGMRSGLFISCRPEGGMQTVIVFQREVDATDVSIFDRR